MYRENIYLQQAYKGEWLLSLRIIDPFIIFQFFIIRFLTFYDDLFKSRYLTMNKSIAIFYYFSMITVKFRYLALFKGCCKKRLQLNFYRTSFSTFKCLIVALGLKIEKNVFI